MVIQVGGEAWREEPTGSPGKQKQGVQATVGPSGDGPAVVVRDVDWGVGSRGCELDGTYTPFFDDACCADEARELLNCVLFSRMRGDIHLMRTSTRRGVLTYAQLGCTPRDTPQLCGCWINLGSPVSKESNTARGVGGNSPAGRRGTQCWCRWEESAAVWGCLSFANPSFPSIDGPR